MKITLNNVSFRYNGNYVLKDVNAEFETGKIYVVVGETAPGRPPF